MGLPLRGEQCRNFRRLCIGIPQIEAADDLKSKPFDLASVEPRLTAAESLHPRGFGRRRHRAILRPTSASTLRDLGFESAQSPSKAGNLNYYEAIT
jgi:hypothetical protein